MDEELEKRRPKLVSLNLQGNQLAPLGIHALGQALETTASLKSLNLASVGLSSDHGSALEALKKGIMANSSLTKVRGGAV